MKNRNIAKITGVLDEIESLKCQLAEKENRINAEQYRTTDWKRLEIRKARNETAERIAALYDGISDSVEGLKADAAAHFNRFDYSDTKLQGAVSFIKANGAGLPETAWQQMIDDFAEQPAVLRYLAQLFNSNGTIDGAIAATEKANVGNAAADFPQRLDDFMFYSTTAPAEKQLDYSGYRSQLSAFDDALAEGDAE